MKMTPRFLFTLPIVIVPLSALAAAQKTPTLAETLAKVQKAVEKDRLAMHVPGAALAIVKDGKVILMRGFGERDLQKGLPVTPDTLFAIGSSTKAFTAALVTMAVDEGKLALNDSPHKYLPYFKLEDSDADGKITISDLMCHRSGVMRTDYTWISGALNSEEAIQSLATAKPTAKLGAKFQYQNLMFLAAGLTASAVEGKTWQGLIASRIFEPLGMNESNTSVPTTLEAKDHAHGYDWSDNPQGWNELPMRNIVNVAPAGAINSNARDMAKWVRFMLGDGTADGKRLVSEKGFADLTAKHMSMGPGVDYGYGWMLHDWNGHKVAEHGGNIDGFSAEVALMPDQHLGFVMLTNLNATPLGSAAMEDIWSAFVPVKDGAPALKPGVPDHPEQEEGDYLLALNNTNFEIRFKENRLHIHPAGQPDMVLQSMGGRRYMILPPAPPKVFVTFQPSKEDPKQTEMVLEQSGMKFTLKKPKPYVSPISVNDLMAKMLAAMGEANMAKHKSLSVRYTAVYENQGATSTGVVYKESPDKFAAFEVAKAVGKTVFTIHVFFDGKRAIQDVSFIPTQVLTGAGRAAIQAEGGLSEDTDWPTKYAKVEIVKMDKVNGEDAYVVRKTPKVGPAATDYVSAKTFLILKSETSEGSETFGDYRNIDGVMIPFKSLKDSVILGKVDWQAYDVQFDAPAPFGAFEANLLRQAKFFPAGR